MKARALKGSIICKESVEVKATFEAKAESALMVSLNSPLSLAV